MYNNNKIPLISVLIPVYNVESYVEESVRSIMNQSYNNLQIIIIDDCSTDSTNKILMKLAVEDERILLLHNKINCKIASSLNTALKFAKGKFIARMDGDDICNFDRIEKQYLFLKENPDISLVGTGINLINENNEIIKKEIFPIDQDKIKKSIFYSSPVLHIWLARIEVYNSLGGYRMSGVEDYDFLLRLLSSGFSFTNIPDCLYCVRIRNGNTISTMGLIQRKLFKYAKKLYKERVSTGMDSFSNTNLEKIKRVFKFESYMYKLSSYFLNNFIIKRNIILRVGFISLAVLSSPYHQLEYLYNRYMYKKITRKK